ncbi:MAG: hypothetical protein ACRD44_06460 [Bryobacteraceae bacterium]
MGLAIGQKQPPPWNSHDPFESFCADAEYNERATAHNFPVVFGVLRRVHDLFKRFEEAIEKENSEQLLVPRFLMVRVHSAFLAGVRLVMSGQVLESFPVSRSAVESAWYCLHIAKDPSPPSRATVWLNRNESETDKARCKSEFTTARVRKTHENLDAPTAKQFHEIYESLIDFRGTPQSIRNPQFIDED